MFELFLLNEVACAQHTTLCAFACMSCLLRMRSLYLSSCTGSKTVREPPLLSERLLAWAGRRWQNAWKTLAVRNSPRFALAAATCAFHLELGRSVPPVNCIDLLSIPNATGRKHYTEKIHAWMCTGNDDTIGTASDEPALFSQLLLAADALLDSAAGAIHTVEVRLNLVLLTNHLHMLC